MVSVIKKEVIKSPEKTGLYFFSYLVYNIGKSTLLKKERRDANRKRVGF